MSAKRKDKKGRVLRTGESQRKDLTYQYRYQDVTGKRLPIHSHDGQCVQSAEKHHCKPKETL